MARENSNISRRGFLAGAAAVTASGVAGGLVGAPLELELDHVEGVMNAESPQDPASSVDEETFAHAEKLVGLQFTADERAQMTRGFSRTVARYQSLRDQSFANGLHPATTFRPLATVPDPEVEVSSATDPGVLPRRKEDIAFAPVTRLAGWLRRGQLSSERLTKLYIERLKKWGPQLQCVITLTEELALQQARRADRELAMGQRRSLIHGIPWGAKDLLDTAAIATTWGARPFASRVPDVDATVVRKLEEAGAVLVAKLTLGALAYGDVWYGGTTRNPWNVEQGSSGSSAGSAAATAAGLVGFAIGSETLGSIVSPCMRCGSTGLRPTFGRVSRAGAMALCWSLDKLGPITRTVEDAAWVLSAIGGAEGDDSDPAAASKPPFAFDVQRSLDGVRVGVDESWFARASSGDRAALAAVRASGDLEVVDVSLPQWPYDSLMTILHAEAAAAFDELTRTDIDDQLVSQEAASWPNTFRQSRFIPAVELIQAQRFRRRVCEMMNELFQSCEVLLAPSYAANLLLISNNTGHPSLTLRTAIQEFRGRRQPQGTTLIGGLYDEGTLCRVGMEIERRLQVASERPVL